MEKFDVDTTCPCVAMTTTLPQCHIHHLIVRLNHVITSLQRAYKLFQSTIASPHPSPCTNIERHHSAAPRRHPELTGVLLESYETISKVTLDVAIVQHHNNSRVRDLPTTDLGSVLCYIKRLLVTTDIRPSVTTHTVTLEHKNIEQMVPYTCQTLKDAFHVLRQVKSDILETFYSRFR
ncbi:uncharacterized protein LOC128182409 [Crassostrea angulata]|nr:uncharacterized protein LOC128182409 [Crassostrea angulata]